MVDKVIETQGGQRSALELASRSVRLWQPHLLHGRVDLDVDIVAQLVGLQVGRKGDVALAAEGPRE